VLCGFKSSIITTRPSFHETYKTTSFCIIKLKELRKPEKHYENKYLILSYKVFSRGKPTTDGGKSLNNISNRFELAALDTIWLFSLVSGCQWIAGRENRGKAENAAAACAAVTHQKIERQRHGKGSIQMPKLNCIFMRVLWGALAANEIQILGFWG